VEYCSRCRPREAEYLCNLCANVKPLSSGKAREFLQGLPENDVKIKGLSNWEFSEGRDIYIFYGKSAISNLVIAARKATGRVVKTNKVGFMEKLKRFFT